MALIIRGGTLLTPAGPATADLRIEGGRISALGEGVATSGDETLDAGGCYVLPGGIDPHTHIEMPAGGGEFNADDWYSGTAAALAGGTTTVLDMITPERGGTLTAALGDWQGRAALRAACDYSFHMGLIEDSPALLAEMAAIVAAGVPSFKIYLAYKGRLMIDDGAAFRILRRAGALGALTLAHCENGEIIDTLIADRRAAGDLAPGNHPRVRPSLAEGEATARAIALAQLARAPLYVVHVTCREAIGAIAAARGQGQAVYGEACAHHLTLTEAEYERPGFAAAPMSSARPCAAPPTWPPCARRCARACSRPPPRTTAPGTSRARRTAAAPTSRGSPTAPAASRNASACSSTTWATPWAGSGSWPWPPPTPPVSST